MKILVTVLLLAASVLIAGPTQTQAADQNEDAFHRCTNHMTLFVLKDGKILDKKGIINRVITDCNLDIPYDLTKPQRDAWHQRAQLYVAAQIEKIAPRAKAERAEEDQSTRDYFLCLERYAKILALGSDETADIVVKASLSACPSERMTILEVYERHKALWGEDTMKVFEDRLVPYLLLKVVEIRAIRNMAPAPAPAPAPEPEPRKTQI